MHRFKVSPDGRGRFRSVVSQSVRIYVTGIVRMAFDLPTADRFLISVDPDQRLLIFKPTKKEDTTGYSCWYSNKAARSPLITANRALRALNLNPQEIAGTYVARVLKGQIVVDLNNPIVE